MQQFWDERYHNEEYVYGVKPNTFFKQELDKLGQGSILLPAEGEGRNAVYASKQGWNVLAFDFSRAGKEKALQLASQNNVSINYRIDSFDTFASDKNTYDCLALIYNHMPSKIRPEVHKKLISYVKPNGTIILEAFSKKQIIYNSGGPGNVDLLYSIEDLKDDFSALKILKIEEKEIYLKEGNFHTGDAMVIRLTAIKL
jgi:2-polyprenyl-3-methyl-5-hydroxy-6-metoxy-1,4-benzoquinol methylase